MNAESLRYPCLRESRLEPTASTVEAGAAVSIAASVSLRRFPNSVARSTASFCVALSCTQVSDVDASTVPMSVGTRSADTGGRVSRSATLRSSSP